MKMSHVRSWCLSVPALIALSGACVVDHVHAASTERFCVVTDIMYAGGYSYIGCREGSREVWLALPEIALPIGEAISFPDVPPLVNFRSKSLDRAFDQIHFVPGLSRLGSDQRNPRQGETTYSGTDENGTMVFSDNPAKVPDRQQRAKPVGASRKSSDY